MIQAADFIKECKKNNISPIIEVPCSIFKDLLNYLFDTKEIEVINPVNEAVVMANAVGSYLSTKKIPIVMIQNSGLNNTLNSLTSLNKQYKIPVLYLISWRGELKDAPEHDFMGKNLEKILEIFEIPFKILTSNYQEELKWAVSLANRTEHSTALIMKKGFIDGYSGQVKENNNFPLDRWRAIEILVDNSSENSVYISTNGFPSRVLYSILKQRGKEDGRAFYMVGSMGHALGIGQEVAKNTKAKVIVIDGDGGALMHLGSMAGAKNYLNLTHIILDNKAYGSTGTQPTLSKNINFKKLGESFGYNVYEATTEEDIKKAIEKSKTPSLIHININQNEVSEEQMERVEHSCYEIKQRFMGYLEKFK